MSADRYFTLGANAQRQGDFPCAVEYFKQALAIYEREEDARAVFTYGILGGIAKLQQEPGTAKSWYQKELQKAEYFGLKESQANARLALGCIAAEQGDSKEALKCYTAALQTYEDLQDQSNIADALNNLGQLLIDMGAYNWAKEPLQKSIKISERIGDVFLVAANYNILGQLSRVQNDFTSAKIWFEKAASKFETIGDEENATVARSNLEEVTADEATQHQKEEYT